MVIFSREWAMPSGDTLSIPLIRRLFEKYRPKGDSVIVDPFARNCKLGTIRNDLNPEFDTQYHLDALEFLKTLKEDSADMVVFDPPYSVAQAASIYKSFGKEKLEINVANAKYWSMCRKHISRILKNGGGMSFLWMEYEWCRQGEPRRASRGIVGCPWWNAQRHFGNRRENKQEPIVSR